VYKRQVVEDSSGTQVGEIRAVWHLYKRQYDLFLHDTQFGAVRSGLLAWEFEVKDEEGASIARVDRNFTGFARELFSDYGHYAVHFGAALQDADPGLTRGQHPREAANAAGGDALAPSTTDVWHPSPHARPLQLTERAACLALAIAADFDYFSQHSSSTGLMGGLAMPMPMPMPFPVPGGGASDTASAGGVAGTGADEVPQQEEEGPSSGTSRPGERDWRDREFLGGDEPFKPEAEQPSWSDKWFGNDEDGDDGDDGDDDDDADGGGGGFGTLGRVLGTIWDSNREE
jgi:hypothetical protein